MHRPVSVPAVLIAGFAVASCADGYPFYGVDTPREAYEASAQNEILSKENSLRLERQQQQSEALLRGQSTPPHSVPPPEELPEAERQWQQLRQSDDQTYPYQRDRMDNALQDLDRRTRTSGGDK